VTVSCSSGNDGFVVAVWDKNSVSLKHAEPSVAEGSAWDKLCSVLADDEVAFGAVTARLEGAVIRHVFFTWCGPLVSAMKRGKVSLQKNAVYNSFEGVVCEVYAADRDELAKDVVCASIAKSLMKSVVMS
jgi:hypothetical protein